MENGLAHIIWENGSNNFDIRILKMNDWMKERFNYDLDQVTHAASFRLIWYKYVNYYIDLFLRVFYRQRVQYDLLFIKATSFSHALHGSHRKATYTSEHQLHGICFCFQTVRFAFEENWISFWCLLQYCATFDADAFFLCATMITAVNILLCTGIYFGNCRNLTSEIPVKTGMQLTQTHIHIPVSLV